MDESDPIAMTESEHGQQSSDSIEDLCKNSTDDKFAQAIRATLAAAGADFALQDRIESLLIFAGSECDRKIVADDVNSMGNCKVHLAALLLIAALALAAPLMRTFQL